jgi:hypothetical protein
MMYHLLLSVLANFSTGAADGKKYGKVHVGGVDAGDDRLGERSE